MTAEERSQLWSMGIRECSWCNRFVPAEQAHWQKNCVGTVFCCVDCLMADAERQRVRYPEAKVELKATKPPPALGALWAMLMEESEE